MPAEEQDQPQNDENTHQHTNSTQNNNALSEEQDQQSDRSDANPDQALHHSLENTGHWEADEKRRFLNALRKYGLDWRMIHHEVRTRGIKNVRAHAQKLKKKLKKLLESHDTSEP